MGSVTNKDIIDYLLGKISPDKEDSFLAKCFSSDENAERFELVREELIENYLRNNLSKEDKLRFENHFLKDPQHRELFVFAGALREQLSENRQLAAVALAAQEEEEKKSFLSTSWLVPVLAFGVLLIGGFFAFQFLLRSQNKEIVKIETIPTPVVTETPVPSVSPITTVTPTPEISPTITPSVNPTLSPSLTPTPKPTVTPKSTPIVKQNPIMAFTLPLIAKGNDDKGTLKIPKQKKQVDLFTPEPFKKFSAYQVQIQKDGKVVWEKNYNKFKKNKKGQIIINVPTNVFREGKNRFVIFGKGKESNIKELKGTERFFNVVREK